MQTVKVIIVEDSTELAAQLTALFESDPRFSVALTLPSAQNIVEEVRRVSADLILMDIHMPMVTGIEAVKLLRDAGIQTPILMQTVHEEDDKVFSSIQAGANGYILKTTQPQRLLDYALDATMHGAPFSPGIARKVLDYIRGDDIPESQRGHLTNRHFEIIDLLIRGFSYKEIADKLNIAVDTVGYHIKTIYTILHIKSRNELSNPTGWWHRLLNKWKMGVDAIKNH